MATPRPRATFTVDGEESDAPAGTMLLVDRETKRGAVAAEPQTTVLVGGRREQAIEHLKIAYANNPETREWAAGDDDLESVRDDPVLG